MSLRRSAFHETGTRDPRVVVARIAIVISASLMIAACATSTQRVIARGDPSADESGREAAGALAAVHVRYTGSADLAAQGDELSYGRRKTGTVRASLMSARHEAHATSVRRPGEPLASLSAPAAGFPGVRNVANADTPEAPATTAAPFDDIDLASIAFDVPTSMTLERRTLIQLVLSAATKQHEANLAETALSPVQHARQYVEARLSGNGFLIEPVTGDTQAIAGPDPTRWLWLVTPTQAGEHRLRVTVAALSDPASAPMRRTLPAFEHTIHVRTSWTDELRARVPVDTTWLLAALCAVPLALGWLYLRWRRKHRHWFHGRL